MQSNRTRRDLRFEPLEGRRLLSGNDPLAALNDEFDGAASLADWQRVYQTEGWAADQLETLDINQTQPGRMVMQPHSSVWYQDYRGPLVFKNVSGDFVMTTELHVGDRDDVGDNDADNIPNGSQFSLGGLMIRTPREISSPADWVPGTRADDGTNIGENFVFLSLGHAMDGGNSLEVKTTRNSDSQLELTPTTAESAKLQIARIGNTVLTLYQLPGEAWTVHRRYSRPDMPATLQVGVVSYTDWGKASDYDPFFHNANVLQQGQIDPTPGEPFNPDIEAAFEYARFATPEVPPELDGLDLVANGTNEQLLAFLGDNADCAGGCHQVTDATGPRFELQVTDTDGAPLESVKVGQTFLVHATVDDLREGGGGVFSAYVDVEFDGDRAEVAGPIEFSSVFPNANEGDTTTAGVVDEAGGIADLEPTGSDPVVVFSVPMIATQAGSLTLATNPADNLPAHEITLYGLDEPVDPAAVEYELVTIDVVDNVWHNGTNPQDVSGDGHNSPVDAVLLIDVLNTVGPGPLPDTRTAPLDKPHFYDVDNDGKLAPVDLLLVIDGLNEAADARHQPGGGSGDAGEGESSADILFATLGEPHGADAESLAPSSVGGVTAVAPSSAVSTALPRPATNGGSQAAAQPAAASTPDELDDELDDELLEVIAAGINS